MTSEQIQQKATEILKKDCHAIGIGQDYSKIPIRLFKTSTGEICYFTKHSHKYGHRLSNLNLIDIQAINRTKTNEQKWIDGWTKVKNRLIISGLWEIIIKEIDIALEIGYEKMVLAYDQYWKLDDQEKINYFKNLNSKLIGINDEGREFVKSNIIWSYSKLPKVKKMRFEDNSERNEIKLACIKIAMLKKTTYSESGRTNYDISFNYKPEANKAWYSEEFKDCGNGHYYVALDSTHCLFIEDD